MPRTTSIDAKKTFAVALSFRIALDSIDAQMGEDELRGDAFEAPISCRLAMKHNTPKPVPRIPVTDMNQKALRFMFLRLIASERGRRKPNKTGSLMQLASITSIPCSPMVRRIVPIDHEREAPVAITIPFQAIFPRSL